MHDVTKQPSRTCPITRSDCFWTICNNKRKTCTKQSALNDRLAIEKEKEKKAEAIATVASEKEGGK